MTRVLRTAVAGLALVVSLVGQAAQEQQEALEQPGAVTSRWLSLQSGGSQASALPQAAQTLAREKAVERQLKTYDFPIPASAFGSTFSTTSAGR